MNTAQIYCRSSPFAVLGQILHTVETRVYKRLKETFKLFITRTKVTVCEDGVYVWRQHPFMWRVAETHVRTVMRTSSLPNAQQPSVRWAVGRVRPIWLLYRDARRYPCTHPTARRSVSGIPGSEVILQVCGTVYNNSNNIIIIIIIIIIKLILIYWLLERFFTFVSKQCKPPSLPKHVCAHACLHRAYVKLNLKNSKILVLWRNLFEGRHVCKKINWYKTARK